MEVVVELIFDLLLFEGGKWPRRFLAVVLWFGILGIAHALSTGVHGGVATTVIMTLGGGIVASVVADRVAGVRMLPAPSLCATLGVGLIVGVLGGGAIATHYHAAKGAAEIWMVGGAIVAEIIVVSIYGAICIALAVRHTPAPASAAQAWNRPDQK